MKSADLCSLLSSFGLKKRSEVAAFFFVNASTVYRWTLNDEGAENIEGFPKALLDAMARRSKRAHKPDLGAFLREQGPMNTLAHFFDWLGLEVEARKRSVTTKGTK